MPLHFYRLAMGELPLHPREQRAFHYFSHCEAWVDCLEPFSSPHWGLMLTSDTHEKATVHIQQGLDASPLGCMAGTHILFHYGNDSPVYALAWTPRPFPGRFQERRDRAPPWLTARLWLDGQLVT